MKIISNLSRLIFVLSFLLYRSIPRLGKSEGERSLRSFFVRSPSNALSYAAEPHAVSLPGVGNRGNKKEKESISHHRQACYDTAWVYPSRRLRGNHNFSISAQTSP